MFGFPALKYIDARNVDLATVEAIIGITVERKFIRSAGQLAKVITVPRTQEKVLDTAVLFTTTGQHTVPTNDEDSNANEPLKSVSKTDTDRNDRSTFN